MSTTPASVTVPAGFTLHTENTSAVLLPAAGNDAFLNPVQEFNRDLSVACIRAWGARAGAEKERKWRAAAERRARRVEAGEGPRAKKVKSEWFGSGFGYGWGRAC